MHKTLAKEHIGVQEKNLRTLQLYGLISSNISVKSFWNQIYFTMNMVAYSQIIKKEFAFLAKI